MEKSMTGKCSHQLWLVILILFVLCLILFSFDYSIMMGANNEVPFSVKQPNPLTIVENQTNSATNQSFTDQSLGTYSDIDPCSGRYIYVHDLPSRFNHDLLKNCRSLTRGTNSNMCPYMAN